MTYTANPSSIHRRFITLSFNGSRLIAARLNTGADRQALNMDEERPNILMEQIRCLQTFMRAQIKWFTQLPILIVLILAIPNPISLSHAFLEGVGPLIGLEEPSLATLVGVAMLFLILERVIVIEDEIAKGMPLRINQRKDNVNPELGDHLRRRKVSRVDIIQISVA
jgi:hypothetical protein